jgi:hypothetical protein
MFLLGGTPFSGKTLLAHLLNQGEVACIDEPDFHDIRQSHRGTPVLREMFPGSEIPDHPKRNLTFREGMEYLEKCEQVVRPVSIGMKTAGRVFLEYARIYRESGYPVIAVIRDIRDVLAEAPLPEWIRSEQDLAAAFLNVWSNLDVCDEWFRYEDFVADPDTVLMTISRLIGRELHPVSAWNAASVQHTMFKLERHDMLREGRISRSQTGIWRRTARSFDDDIHAAAEAMGYAR